MDPATSEELDHIIRELMHDDGPPLEVSSDGHTWAAGTRPLSSGTARSLIAREQANKEWKQAKWESYQRQRDRLIGYTTSSDPVRPQPEADKLAGDVFHGDLERMDLGAATRKALKEWKDQYRRDRGAEAIRRAVHGSPDPNERNERNERSE